MDDGRLLQVNVSAGGVPKLPVEQARITRYGVEGDRQREETVHGGPHRAVSILGIEAIERVAAEGHPIGPGTTGENLTVSGFDVSTLPAGTRLAIGQQVVLELSAPANPCRTIRHSFSDLRFGRLGIASHVADSRMYARVVREGVVRPGDPIRITAPADDGAERINLAGRLDGAERASALAVWSAAQAARLPVSVVDDGDLAMSAAPGLPGPAFNLALGFAHLPNLMGRAVAHFTAHGVTGWVWADDEPWADAIVDSTASYVLLPVEASHAEDPTAAPATVRELARDEVGPWSSVISAASGLDGPEAEAFVTLEPQLALSAHHHRFVAEADGRVVGVASLHTHHQVGWLRAGTVLPEYRGRGIQRALIEARLAHAARLGCDAAGASANAVGSSARNLDRVGGRVVATRRRYRVVPRD